jgi:hypothetical protein
MHAFFFLFGPSNNMGALFLKPGPGLGGAKENWERFTPASANFGWSSRYLHQLPTYSRQQCHHTHTHRDTEHQVELPTKRPHELLLLQIYSLSWQHKCKFTDLSIHHKITPFKQHALLQREMKKIQTTYDKWCSNKLTFEHRPWSAVFCHMVSYSTCQRIWKPCYMNSWEIDGILKQTHGCIFFAWNRSAASAFVRSLQQ